VSHHHVNRSTLKSSANARFVADDTWRFVETATGHLGLNDCYFLLTLIEETRPKHLLEIGVASGASSLMVLRMLEHLQLDSALVSIDVAETYFAEPSQPVGYVVTDEATSSKGRWTLLTSVQSSTFAHHPKLKSIDPRRRFDLLFIDANHSHPWPTLDLLCLLPFASPASWVAFHDINLPLLGDYRSFGAVYPVTDWPLDVMISDEPGCPNIGAIQLADAGAEDATRLIRMLDRPWDTRLDRRDREQILTHLATLLSDNDLVAVESAFNANAALLTW
jgi:hypothetical protein